MNEEPKAPEAKPDRKGLSIPPRFVAAAVVLAALVVLVVQNHDDVDFEWLVFDMTAPLWVLILVPAVVGAAVTAVSGFLRRIRRRIRR